MKRNILIFIFLILAATSFKYRSKTQAGILNPDSRVLIEQTTDSSHDPVVLLETKNDEIRSLENQEREAYIKKDTIALSRLWSQDLVVTNSDNSVKTIYDIKNDFSKSAKSNPPFDRIIEKITINGNVAIVMGHENCTASISSGIEEKNVSRRFSNVWIKNGSTWKLAARQSTNISDKQ